MRHHPEEHDSKFLKLLFCHMVELWELFVASDVYSQKKPAALLSKILDFFPTSYRNTLTYRTAIPSTLTGFIGPCLSSLGLRSRSSGLR